MSVHPPARNCKAALSLATATLPAPRCQTVNKKVQTELHVYALQGDVYLMYPCIGSPHSKHLSGADYGFDSDYSDEEPEDEDVDIENQYYNSKGRGAVALEWLVESACRAPSCPQTSGEHQLWK